MSDRRCWGVFRESAHSPGRESDDAEILRLTAKELEAKGFQVTLLTPDEIGEAGEPPGFVFLMCERLEVLARLRDLERRGVVQVNSPRAVRRTYREAMIRTLARAGVPFIESRLVSTGARVAPGALPIWVKRADVHNTREGDVTLAATSATMHEALRGLAERGVGRAVLQPHLEGDLVKFYGIGVGAEPPWFRWFYHRDQVVAGHPLEPGRLARLVGRAAMALGLEVYGGDAIVTEPGDLVLLDVNAWPSFALYRDEASARIAGYLAARFAGSRR